MPLITCPDCHKEVSDQATACIHCGRPLARDLVQHPSAGSAQSAKEGRQRSKLRNNLGNAIAFIGLAIAIVIGIASGSFLTGFVIVSISIGIGMWIAYGW